MIIIRIIRAIREISIKKYAQGQLLYRSLNNMSVLGKFKPAVSFGV